MTADRCTTNVRRTKFTSIVCGEPAVGVVAVGCIHEHIDVQPVCVAHQAALDMLRMLCRACRVSKRPHECPLHFRPAPMPQDAQ